MASERRPLWAPWRVDFIRGAKEDGCFFCRKAAAGAADLAHHVVFRGEQCFCLLNEFPYNSGHLLVAPYAHVPDILALSDAQRNEVMALLCAARTTLAAALAAEGFNIGCNLGRVAGAAVADHVHFHVVPRWLGDTSFMPVIADTDSVPEALDATARLLRDHWPGSGG